MSETTETETAEVEGTETPETPETPEPTAGTAAKETSATAPARVSRETARGSAPVSQLEKEGDIAADYLEGLLDIADLDGDIDMDVEGDRALVSIVGGDISQLVGRDGEVLEALQEL